MSRGKAPLAAVCAAALLLISGFCRPVWSQDAGQPQKQEAKAEDAKQVTAEEKEIIEHMEMLRDMQLYDNGDLEMLLTLDVLTANE